MLSVLAVDNFNRADNVDLGIAWDVMTGEAAAGWQIVANTAQPDSFANDASESNNSLSVWPADQYAQAKVTIVGTTGGNTGMGVGLRMSTSARTYYRIVVDHAATNNLGISKFIAGVSTSLALFTTTWVDGDVLRAQVTGTRISVYQNGTLIGAVTDVSIVEGRPGVTYSSTETSGSLDDWEAGSADAGGGSVDVWRARPSVNWSMTSTIGQIRSAWSDAAGILDSSRDAREGYQTRNK